MVIAMLRSVAGLMPISLDARDVPTSGEAGTAQPPVSLLKIVRGVCRCVELRSSLHRKGVEGYTAACLDEAVSTRFRNQEFINLTRPDDTPQTALLRSSLESKKEVVKFYQMAINRPGLGFKGLFPAVFTPQPSERLFEKTGIRLYATGADCRFPATSRLSLNLKCFTCISIVGIPR